MIGWLLDGDAIEEAVVVVTVGGWIVVTKVGIGVSVAISSGSPTYLISTIRALTKEGKKNILKIFKVLIICRKGEKARFTQFLNTSKLHEVRYYVTNYDFTK